MKLKGVDFNSILDGWSVAQYSKLELDKVDDFAWLNFDGPIIKAINGRVYKLMTSKSKVGKRKVLVRLTREIK